MTTRAELQALLEHIEAASGPSREIDGQIGTLAGIGPFRIGGAIWNAHFDNRPNATGQAWSVESYNECPPYTSSLDAIVGLIERELPDYTFSALSRGKPGCYIWRPHSGGDVDFRGYAATIALSCCAAFIRAKLAMLEASDAG